MKCCDIYAGKLRSAIAIERLTLGTDAIGGNSQSWATNKSLKAFIKPMSGGEYLHSQRLEARLSHRIYIRYTADILNTDRVVYNGRNFQIRAIINIEERNKWIELHCEEGVAQ
tara:strand:+ start:3311 stop:3649 length:339 start_codon:yes stop_codon:yes gene_type:complete